MGHYGLTFWMPTLIKSTGVIGTLRIGLLTAIPYLGAIVVMNVLGRERRQAARAPLAHRIAAGLGAGFLVAEHVRRHSDGGVVIALSLAAAGMLSSAPFSGGCRRRLSRRLRRRRHRRDQLGRQSRRLRQPLIVG